MAKKKIDKSNVVLVNNLDSFLTKCKNELKRSLANDKIEWSEEKFPGEKIIYSISKGNGTTANSDHSKNLWVVPLLSYAPQTIFWINISITFFYREEIEKHELAGTSLKVFKGLIRADEKHPIFRAEWDAQKKDSKIYHEQPHWHVYPKEKFLFNDNSITKDFYEMLKEEKEEEKVSFVNSLKEEDEEIVLPFIHPDIVELDNFHFAMCSLWHKGNKEKTKLEEATLPIWMAGCTNYMRSQLIYLTTKNLSRLVIPT